jgi:predicted  nucleic acid-binding Zn-ribbon protein
MAWYLNHYHCTDCGTSWTDEWSATCDDECPNCGSRNWSPYESEDLSTVVQREGNQFVVLHSPRDVEEDRPRYEVVARLSSTILADVVAEAMRAATQE